MNYWICVYRSSTRIIEICPLDVMKTGKILFRMKYDVLLLSTEDAEGKATQENHVRDWWSKEKLFDSKDSVQRPLGIATEEKRLPG